MKKFVFKFRANEDENIKVEQDVFTFDYTITIDGKKKKKQWYYSDYENGQTAKQWKRTLERGEAINYTKEYETRKKIE